MRRFALLMILAATVVSSGCISSITSSSQETAPKNTAGSQEAPAACERQSIDVRRTQGTNVLIEQTSGNIVLGEIEVTWTYENGEQTTKTVNMTDLGRIPATTSETSGTLQKVKAVSKYCPTVTDTAQIE